jgi:hypothetical protein
LPASAEARAAVEREVEELERLCLALEHDLVGGRWDGASQTLRDTRRVTHALLNAMDAAAPYRDEPFDAALNARVKRVFDLRDDQLHRLQEYRDQVGERLQTFSRWKSFARSIGAKNARSKRTVGLDSRR